MTVCETVRHLREEIARARCSVPSKTIGFVPTMGALHEGHLSLIAAARRECDTVVVSIFVNPEQFGPDEDCAEYPRPVREDEEKCHSAGVDLVFRPSAAEMYGSSCLTTVHVDEVTSELCGRYRPGHFDGVALVVTKLFNMVQPNRAYFGQKDAQQLALIRQLVQDLSIPVRIVGLPIVREVDGLAFSSRNASLEPTQRVQAAVLYRALQAIRDSIHCGVRDSELIVGNARELIESAGPCEIDYVELVDPQTMLPISQVAGPVLATLAVRIGACRLIDNLAIDDVPSGSKAEPVIEHR